jgi:hypothetical protein
MAPGLRCLSVCAGLWVTTAALAQEWRHDVWHRVTADSPFFSPDRRDYPSAGVLQGDGQFLLLVLGEANEGALVSVVLPGSEPQAELSSTIVLTSGNALTRTIAGAELLAVADPETGSVTYSFRIPPQDLETVMAGRSWQFAAGREQVDITLDGSRKAISEAIADRDALAFR